MKWKARLAPPAQAPKEPEERDLLRITEAIIERAQTKALLAGMFLEQMDRAVRHAAAADMAALIDGLFRSIIAFDTQFLLRAQWQAARCLAAWDGGAVHDPPHELVEEILPRLERIEAHLLTIVQQYARTRHLLDLTADTEKKRGGRAPEEVQDGDAANSDGQTRVA